MNDPPLVGVVERLRHVRSQGGRGLGGHRSIPLQPLGEWLAVDQLHDQRGIVVRAGDVVDGGDGRMREGLGSPRLALQPAPGRGVRQQVRMQELDCHGAVQLRVACPPDARGAAHRDLTIEAVAAQDEAVGGHAASSRTAPLHESC